MIQIQAAALRKFSHKNVVVPAPTPQISPMLQVRKENLLLRYPNPSKRLQPRKKIAHLIVILPQMQSPLQKNLLPHLLKLEKLLHQKRLLVIAVILNLK